MTLHNPDIMELIGYRCLTCNEDMSVAQHEAHLEANPDHNKFRANYGDKYD